VAAQNRFLVETLAEPRTLYRGARDAHQPVDACRSNYELGRKPHPADLRAHVLAVAVSMFEDGGFVAQMCRRHPARIGSHVVRFDLRPGMGICLADTSGPGHWSIWGHPDALSACIVSITPA
jgi:hypothetical protein